MVSFLCSGESNKRSSLVFLRGGPLAKKKTLTINNVVLEQLLSELETAKAEGIDDDDYLVELHTNKNNCVIGGILIGTCYTQYTANFGSRDET